MNILEKKLAVQEKINAKFERKIEVAQDALFEAEHDGSTKAKINRKNIKMIEVENQYDRLCIIAQQTRTVCKLVDTLTVAMAEHMNMAKSERPNDDRLITADFKAHHDGMVMAYSDAIEEILSVYGGEYSLV